MYYRKPAYVAAVALAGLGSVVAAGIYSENDLMVLALGNALLAVLTFPLGATATAIGSLLIFLGVVTPTESVFLMTPVHAVLGYTQWFWLLPAIYRRQS